MSKTSGLNVFVHIPKTAGSTVNSYLQRSGKSGRSHAETWISKTDELRSEVQSADWVSGHINFQQFRSILAKATARRLDFYTVIRDPIKQIMSHYNWLIEISNRGASFYNGHPPRIKEISESIRATDNNNPYKVIEQLEKAPILFLNQQSRIIYGGNWKSVSEENIRNVLSVYKSVSWEGTLPKFIEEISGMPYEVSHRENESPYHFDKSVFQSDEMMSFLNRCHATDIALYKHVKELDNSEFSTPL